MSSTPTGGGQVNHTATMPLLATTKPANSVAEEPSDKSVAAVSTAGKSVDQPKTASSFEVALYKVSCGCLGKAPEMVK